MGDDAAMDKESIRGGGGRRDELLLVNSCYGNFHNLRPCGPLDLARTLLTYHSHFQRKRPDWWVEYGVYKGRIFKACVLASKDDFVYLDNQYNYWILVFHCCFLLLCLPAYFSMKLARYKYKILLLVVNSVLMYWVRQRLIREVAERVFKFQCSVQSVLSKQRDTNWTNPCQIKR